LNKEAERLGIRSTIRNSEWDQEEQSRIVDDVILHRPDLVVFVPVETFLATECLHRFYDQGIPVIASNLSLDEEAYPLILSWTGPDDWGQHRLLARYFAERLERRGGYCIISHKPGTSPYLARVWGVRTEQGSIAPEMTCLDVRFTEFDRERTRLAVLNWIDRYGDRLRGILSADDSYPMEGVKRALAERGRTDILCVANGATRRGFEFVKDGTLQAVTYQSPEMDGMLAMRTAGDWFSGIEVEPIRYLPAMLVTAAEVESFLVSNQGIEASPSEELCRILAEGKLEELSWFFDDLQRRIADGRIGDKLLADQHVVSVDYFLGMMIEMLSGLLNLAKTYNLDGVSLFGGYETLFRGLVNRRQPLDVLNWIRGTSINLLDTLIAQRRLSSSLVEHLISYTEMHYAEPIALKTIAERFGLSAAYLGKLFKERTGHSFSQYLNELRIGKAKALLAVPGAKPKDVAKAVGYAETSYFYSVFRKLAGIGANEYGAR
jgi:ABC-type sugar transport system substrate-binding protein/AraC-like DNA-binding protein